jgi:hypothetical protein
VLAATLVAASIAASAAAADIGIRAVHPSTARPGDVVRVTAHGYLGPKPWPAMPVVMVGASKAPTPYRCRRSALCRPRVDPSALQRAPYVWVGRIRRWRTTGQDSARGELAFRVPRVKPARYLFGLYCAACVPGPSGSLIVDPRVVLVVRRG